MAEFSVQSQIQCWPWSNAHWIPLCYFPLNKSLEIQQVKMEVAEGGGRQHSGLCDLTRTWKSYSSDFGSASWEILWGKSFFPSSRNPSSHSTSGQGLWMSLDWKSVFCFLLFLYFFFGGQREELTHLILKLLQAWKEPLSHFDQNVIHHHKLPDESLNKAWAISSMVHELETGVEKSNRKGMLAYTEA